MILSDNHFVITNTRLNFIFLSTLDVTNPIDAEEGGMEMAEDASQEIVLIIAHQQQALTPKVPC